MKIIKCLAALVAALPVMLHAGNELDGIEDLSQDLFRAFAENLGAATSYKSIAPAEPLGMLGFDIGVEVSFTGIDEALFEKASDSGWDLSTLPLPKLHAHKGLPLNFDVGAFYTSVPETDIRLWGAELRYSFLSGGIATPALAVRLTYSQLEGIDQLDMRNTGVEASVSKGFVMLTPYAGIGKIFTTAEPVGIPALEKEEFEANKIFAGVNINLGLNLGLEIDKTGDVTSYSVKAGIRF